MKQTPFVLDLSSVKRHLKVKELYICFLKFDADLQNTDDHKDIDYKSHIRFFKSLFPNANVLYDIDIDFRSVYP